ncbi:MAG: hypothetical protein QW229_01470 [Desulfurococcaceae archaeon]
MTSTTGGFFVGFGLCLLLVSLGASAALGQYYSQIMEWRGGVERVYNITHSPDYRSAIDALDALSPYATQIADALPWIGLGWLADYIRRIPRAATFMRQVYNSSESAYYAMQAVEVTPVYLQYGMISGLFLIIVGIILVVRTRRKGRTLR